VRVAIYARVSTDEQEPENQLRQLRAWCEVAGHEIVGEYAGHRRLPELPSELPRCALGKPRMRWRNDFLAAA
jgi:hypothetical protein